MNNFKTQYPEFAAIERQIRAARVTRAVALSSAISGFILDCWNALKQPPAPAAILIDRRRESRSNVTRAGSRLAHR
ncbi:MAG: hypothetical protein ACXWG1_12575 [Usitatibacter sp.]